MSLLRLLCQLVLLAVSLCSTAQAVQVTRKPEQAHTATPLFVDGKDVFGRTPRCRTCHVLMDNLNARLLPLLKNLKAIESRRVRGNDAASRRYDYGLYEDVIESHVQSACRMNELWHKRDSRRECEIILDNHGEDLVFAFTRWLRRGMPDEGRAETTDWSWNWEVCYKATHSCSEELSMHILAEFSDDGSGQAERKYRSEPNPPKNSKKHGLFNAVASNFYEVFIDDADVDAIAYVAFPESRHAFHQSLMPALMKVQESFDKNPKGQGWLRIGVVDAELNDIPPPYGTGKSQPTLCVYAAGVKNWPRYITDDNEGMLTVHDLLYFIMNTCSKRVSETARELLRDLSYEFLHHRVWEHDEM
jgi:hypothetical protein|mmetsp:Transcript_1036/g.2773  ORF Transcript_1036/g.2773 Transcript_1036/m.2773 type:complete len:360 (+) Transcript_1036:101-1180(+)